MKTRAMSAEYYQGLFDTCQLIPKWKHDIEVSFINIKPQIDLYKRVVAPTNVPWVFVGLIHWMECDCHSKKQILNGQVYNMATTRHPEHLGPWSSWEESTIAALKKHNLHVFPKDWWTLPRILERLERWNGLGYHNKCVNSPYLWSGSNHGLGVGKYTSDGKYSPTAVSRQIGAGVILKELVKQGIYVPLGIEQINPTIIAMDELIAKAVQVRGMLE